MIGRIITRGRNSGLKCLSTGSLSPFPSLSSLFFPKQRACSQAKMTSTKCSFPTSPRLDRHLLYKIIQMWWKWKRNYRSNRKKSTSAEHDTLKNFEAGILDLKTMARGKMTHFLFVNLLLVAVLWTTGKKPGRSQKGREYKLENSGNEKA